MIQEFIKELKQKGYTQEQIENIAGVPQATISKLSRGAAPNATTLVKLADAFNVSTDYVLGRILHKKEIL